MMKLDKAINKSVKMNLNDKTLTNKFLNTPGRRF